MSLPVAGVEVGAYRVPTEGPESDGTLVWDSTTVLVAEVTAGGASGLGYSYGHRSAVRVASDLLAPVLVGRPLEHATGNWRAMTAAVRNVGLGGVAAAAVSAVDTAMWDLRAKLAGLPLFAFLGATSASVPAYGSGGFTSLDEAELETQLGGWAAAGMPAVKMKVGREPGADPGRVAAARRAVGDDVALYVDANGAYSRKQALAMAVRFAEESVVWFEEPVSSDDVEGLRLLRDRVPPGMEVAAGEYGYGAWHFRRLLEAGAVDVLQADATRCLGVTGFRDAEALSWAHGVALSAHTAPTLHTHLMCAARRARDVEYFADHGRLEGMLFEGALRPRGGALAPDPERPGLGLEMKRSDTERYRV